MILVKKNVAEYEERTEIVIKTQLQKRACTRSGLSLKCQKKFDLKKKMTLAKYNMINT